MPQEQPKKSVLVAQVVLKAGKRCSPFPSGQLPASVAVKNRAVLCDHERLEKSAVTSLGE